MPEPESIHVRVDLDHATNPVLHEILRTVARRTKWSEHEIAIVMNMWFEEMASRLIRGEHFKIPGFGLFGVMCRLRNSPHRPDIRLKTYPAFSGEGTLRRLVLASCRPHDASLNNPFHRYRTHTKFVRGKAGPDLARRNAGIRLRIRAQARRLKLRELLGAMEDSLLLEKRRQELERRKNTVRADHSV